MDWCDDDGICLSYAEDTPMADRMIEFIDPTDEIPYPCYTYHNNASYVDLPPVDDPYETVEFAPLTVCQDWGSDLCVY